jgi:AhpC/TSA family
MPAASISKPVPFTFLDEGRASEGEAFLGGDTLSVTSGTLKSAFGWELKPQGICREEVCIPASARKDLVAGEQVNLNALASVLGRPLVVDAAENTAYLGASAQERADALRSLTAPDFELPDLSGKLHRLSDQRGKKVLLVAYASW